MPIGKFDSKVYSVPLNIGTCNTILSSNSSPINSYSKPTLCLRIGFCLARWLGYFILSQQPSSNGVKTRRPSAVGPHFCSNYLRTCNFKSFESYIELSIQEDRHIIRSRRQKSYLNVGVFWSIVLWTANEISIRSAVYWPVTTIIASMTWDQPRSHTKLQCMKWLNSNDIVV